MSLGTREFIYLLLIIPAIIIAVTIHEYTRAVVSTILGDTTPRNEKRLTINPLNHFEPIGFLLMYATGVSFGGVGIGWGKPVNTNSRHYDNRRLGVVLTAVLPSVVNLLVAVLANYGLRSFGTMSTVLYDFLTVLKSYNIYLIVCNFFPVPPFDCYKILLEFVSRKNYFVLCQQESVLQLIFMLLLFSRLLTYITMPICGALYMIVAALTF